MPGLSELQHRINERIKATPPVRVIVISFVLIILVGTLLLMLPISSKVGGATPIDALFTITSATCVTGLVVGDTFTLWTPFGQGVILACIQLGGLGLSTLAIGFSLLVRRKLGIREMKLASESSGGSGLDIAGLLKLTIIFTFACEAIGACLLAIRFVPMFGVDGIWPSIFCAISAYCNAGFDVLGFVEGNSSMTAFAGDPLVSLTISFLIIIGGLGFIVVQDIYLCKIQPRFHHKDTARLNFHSQICLRVTIVLLLFGTLGFFLLEFGNTMEGLNILEKLNCAFFQSTNTRTAGFASVDIAAQYEFTKVLSVLLMFIGACPGSTGGGIKTTTLTVLLFTVICTIRGKDEVVVLRHRFSTPAVYKAFSLTFIAILLVFIDAGVISSLNPDILYIDCLYEATSAFGTVGLSASVTPNLDPISKLILIFTMFIGRVGPLSFGLSILMRHKPKGDSIYPEGRMIIG